VDRLNLLLLSLRRQRYTNWDAVIVTDGPDRDAAELVESMTDPRLRVIQTPERKGRWGHPYRQIGLEAAAEHGAFVGMANDDDYYAPGYLEQMVQALEWTPADLVLCGMLHAYNGWAATAGFARPDAVSADVGCWLARAELVKRTPWSGAEFTSDSEYVRRLAAGGRSVSINRPLHVKN
jgi:GT2 family glycosyltransferase